ncbi:nuclear transport factor 2 family protein [Winogradskyella sp.]|uniref:nuclear transport factor 2 family protein n=1 Tax=uncultured Winogradskyella sp. TaxID=395353 RepID=UPI0023323A1A|nr:nuclear transport factor 2 family protein [Winogradskyella sp.]MDB9783207.1 nuclear transport factor 2 family protein [Winogradskyella sp.]MDC1503999.1 nuclear transport factor 2 family protein [Winogradskyella sp.]|tara:strand:+ start:50334 stop:50789 length:456 start_codon:yes stop_codon:yes gene_type:complete
MKSVCVAIVFLFGLALNAQKSETEAVKNIIVEFFDAFHKQDSTALKSMVIDKIILQSISTNNSGEVTLKEDNFYQFIKNIASIPKDRKFEEKLLGFNIQVDGNMANAWTPYEFWYQEQFSHCGVNSFQFMKVKGEWKIIYLVDTRRKKCKN